MLYLLKSRGGKLCTTNSKMSSFCLNMTIWISFNNERIKPFVFNQVNIRDIVYVISMLFDSNLLVLR